MLAMKQIGTNMIQMNTIPVIINITFFTDIDLKIAAKFFGSKFACGSSVTGDDEIVIQGDVKDDLFEVIPEKWPQVSYARVGFKNNT